MKNKLINEGKHVIVHFDNGARMELGLALRINKAAGSACGRIRREKVISSQ